MMGHRTAILCFLILPALATYAVAKEPRKSRGFTPGALGMSVPLLTSRRDLDAHLGRLVAVRGPIRRAKVPTILGVSVGNSRDLVVDDAYAVGILVRSEVTAEDLAETRRRSGPIATLGPGVSYTLYFDLAGTLADAQTWPDND